jgi:acyl phosphate:glycerol-3-phosphate acyltransferase
LLTLDALEGQMQSWLLIIIAYLLGSIPFGLLLTRAAGLGDVRSIGSGNIGATNVLRTGNKKVATLTLTCDALKGFVAVWIAQVFGSEWLAMLAGFAAMAGHIFPIWLRFKGGKGVATGLGVLLGWSWPLAAVGLAVWALVFYAARISSLSALVASLVTIPTAYVLASNYVWSVALLALIIFATHHENLGRLWRGEEKKLTLVKPK